MAVHLKLKEPWIVGAYLTKWLAISAPVGIVIGSAVALFLWALERATETRWAHPNLFYAIPLGGLGIGLMYHLFGRSVEGGNNLIIDQIHEPDGGVPARMAPLVLIGTVATHLFGGSAGREGTAVQMGGSVASQFARWLKLNEHDARTLLMAGVAAGFGAVFGTPLAGAVFAMEVLAIGRMSYESLVPCLAASIVGDCTVRAWGIAHSHYYIASFLTAGVHLSHPPLSWLLMLQVVVASLAFGAASSLFAEIAHSLHRLFATFIPWPMLRPVIGGVVLIAMVYLLGTRDYLGLGTNADPATPNAVTIQSCFKAGGATWWSWWWKLIFTAVTLSCGFKGGEVTPLFFIGAALGNSMARLLGAPVDMFAGLGFVAVFAGATNTPLACTIMGLELFLPGTSGLLDSGFGIYLAVACFCAYLFSGHSGIYLSQRIGTPKFDSPNVIPETPLRIHRQLRSGNHESLSGGNGSEPQPPIALVDHEGKPLFQESPVGAAEIGQLRIFLAPRARREPGFHGLFSKALYQEIIEAAKQDGLMNAIAHRMHFGYSGSRHVPPDKHRSSNEYLTLCVELVGTRPDLEAFCQKHNDLLQDKVIVYEKMERWEIGTAVSRNDEPMPG